MSASLTTSDFAAFFQAVHGVEPFPWQQRLVEHVAERGWPALLDLPTGSGKTAALDVALFTLALDAGGSSRKAPRRIVYVIDRRTVVDQAFERARAIERAVVNAMGAVLAEVRNRLAASNVDGVPLRSAALRGGIARDERWARRPDQPLLLVSTVDQVGSRVLFRGYGITDEMKPVHAGLLGNDVLFLLDEVHLSEPFRQTLQTIHGRYRAWAESPLPSPFVVVEMSATPGSSSEHRFNLGDTDRKHPVLARRLEASKPATLVSCSPAQFLTVLDTHVTAAARQPGAATCVVVNRVKTARDLHDRLRQKLQDADVYLLTGRMRPFDRDALEGSLLPRIRAGRERSTEARRIVVVATQSIEAGADFDFDALVTECASFDALRQRFGRLDRLGQRTEPATGVIVARTDSLTGDPVYGNAIGETWSWLQSLDASQVDFGLSSHVSVTPANPGMLTPRENAPILLPAHLDAWVQTAPIPQPDPDVALWLHGPQRGAADVQVVWRADLTEAILARAIEGGTDGERATEAALAVVEALPPVAAEAMSVPFLAVRRWLNGLAEPDSFDVEGALVPDDEDEERTRRTEHVRRPALLWLGEQSRVIDGNRLRPGQTIVVPAAYGGIAHGNWAPGSTTPVPDVAEAAAFGVRRRAVLRLHPAVLAGLFGDAVRPPILPDPDKGEDVVTDIEVATEWLTNLEVEPLDPRARPLLEWLRTPGRRLEVERLRDSDGDDAPEYLVVSARGPAPSADSDFDERAGSDTASSFTGAVVTLSGHQTGVAATAADSAARVGLPEPFAADLTLAGEWHDAGKADVRFQRWLHGGSEFKALVQPEPLAKSPVRVGPQAMKRARERAGYPAGTRHELMSLALFETAAEHATASDAALVRHLIASHHGHCRPFAPCVPDPHPVTVAIEWHGKRWSAPSDHALARLDSGVAERFWQLVRRYGWWGLAWLEAIFRLADHRQSEREQRGKENTHARRHAART